jgi:mannan polymerase II complex MNN10 subunit
MDSVGRPRYVPQHWFNGYESGGSKQFEERDDVDLRDTYWARREDYLVHFAGYSNRKEAIKEWNSMLGNLSCIWEIGRVLRDTSGDIGEFWGD